MQFIPCVEPKVFTNTAPQNWDPNSCRFKTLPPRIRARRIRSLPTGRLIPTIGATSSARSGMTGIGATSARSSSTTSKARLAQWMGQEAQMCVYHEFCGKGVALEHDGNLYSCDHYVYPEYKLGNIMETSSSRMVFSEAAAQVRIRQVQFPPPPVPRVQFPVCL